MKLNIDFKTKPKPPIKEKNIEDKIKKYLSSKNVFYYKSHGDPLQLNGLPDIICSIKGYFVGFELKRPTGKPQISQIVCGKSILDSKGIYVIVDNLEIVQKITELILKGKIKDVYPIIGYKTSDEFIKFVIKKYKIKI